MLLIDVRHLQMEQYVMQQLMLVRQVLEVLLFVAKQIHVIVVMVVAVVD
jgi:hypothetical protein